MGNQAKQPHCPQNLRLWHNVARDQERDGAAAQVNHEVLSLQENL